MRRSIGARLRALLPPYPGLRFHFERLLLRGLYYRLGFAALLIFGIAVVGGLLVLLLDPAFDELGESIWWAFLRLTDPGYLGDDEGFVGRTVSTVITVLGYVLFLGLLISILTQWMNGAIQNVEFGLTPVSVTDHVLILGWTHRTPHIVEELLRTRGRVERFLQAHRARELRVVILAEDPGREQLRELKYMLGNLWSDRLIILRRGSPLKMEDLQRVSYERAAVVILPGADFGDLYPGAADAEALKTLHAISRRAEAAGTALPLAIAGIHYPERGKILRRAYDGDTEIIALDELVSRIIAQSVLSPGLWALYSQLLSLNKGNALYVKEYESTGETTFAELQAGHPRAIVVGILPAGSDRPALAPEPARRVKPGDSLVFIARSYAECSVGQPVSRAAGPALPVDRPDVGSRKILVLGWSRKAPGLLSALARQGGDLASIHSVGLTPVEDRMAAIKNRREQLIAGDLSYSEANFLQPEVLENLQPWSYDHIVILARDRLGEEAYADAATLSATLTLEYLLEGRPENPGIFVELMEAENAMLYEGKPYDVIVSSVVTSYILSQVALKRDLAAVLNELVRTDGAQISLQPLAHLCGENVDLNTLCGSMGDKGETVLGIVSGKGRCAEVVINPVDEPPRQVKAADRLIVIANADSQDAVG